MMNTLQPSALKGNGILGKKVEFVTGDTQTKSDAARASAKRMIEKDGVVMALTTQLVKISAVMVSATSLTVSCLVLHWVLYLKRTTVLIAKLTT